MTFLKTTTCKINTKSTVVRKQSPETHYWLISLILKHEKINIDQL